MRLSLVVVLALFFAPVTFARTTSAEDRATIRTLLEHTWQTPKSPLRVAPVSIVGDHAIAGWRQGERGGRALLHRTGATWSAVLCSGDALLEPAFLREAGVDDADALAAAAVAAERDIPHNDRAAFARFDGVVRMGNGHGPQAGQAAVPYTLPKLPYTVDALQPAVDARTMEIHHGKHHRAYVDNLNAKVSEFPALSKQSIEEVLARISNFDSAVRNNAGGHYNHSLFWTLMAPPDKTGALSADITRQINRDFGSTEAFRKTFSESATKLFGSGWVWLILGSDGRLAITTTGNQDNPLMDVVAERGEPLLALDVWEHAYYLTYQNNRADYIVRWWDVVNWNVVNERFANAQSNGK
jgi:superoxide dismutase, Fe-Mn family